MRVNLLRAAMVAAPVALFLVLYSISHTNVPLISPDSDSYLNFSGSRSGGYPFFLAILKPLVRDASGYVVAQLLLYAFAVLLLAWQLLASFRSIVLSLVAELMLLGNWEVNRYHFAILTESVLLSTSALFLAAALAYLRTGSLPALAAASGLAAYAMTVRPTGIIFVAAAFLLVLIPASRRRIWLRLVSAAIPLIFVVGAEIVYYRAHHSGARTSLLSIQMLGKAGMVRVADPSALIASAPQSSRPLQTALELELEPVRQLVAGAPSIAARCRLGASYESFVEYGFALPQRAQLMAVAGEDALTRAALARLRLGMPDYIALTGDYLFCLWTFWAAEEREKAALAAYLNAHEPVPFQDAVLPSLATSRSPPLIGMARGAMLAVTALFAVAGTSLLVCTGRRHPPGLVLALVGTCGLILHGGLLLSGLAGVGIARYAQGFWVPWAVGVTGSLLWATRLRRQSFPALRPR